ncbi:transposase [Streptomyces kaniharaensis]|uniref:Transposase n=1 Tax=Streptomyces kaniharaensis TaxID=212423 RepID=A0A6N7KLB5_9ACTN|nr:Mu transposase C-terminal domain-containing protein [Streptomyces kaniharaensis]MQS10994.1 transposase [Streptomyces kaniharaensis]
MNEFAASGVLRVGDRVVFSGREHTVVAISGTSIRLLSASGDQSVVLLAYLQAAPDFSVVGAGAAPRATAHGLLDSVPAKVAERARLWEQHLVELESGLLPGVPPGTPPRPEYDPMRATLAQRVAAKARELTALGIPAEVRTVQRMRKRYREQGVWGLVDGRRTQRRTATGNVDSRVVSAVAAVVERQTSESTGTKSRILRLVEEQLTTNYGPGSVPMPSRATFYRLLDTLTAGRHTFGSATTRRQTANRPEGVFTPTMAARPGEQVQIDTTPLDVMAVMDDGVVGRPELTIALDIATRTICAAVLHPARAKAVDAALMLARIVVPEPMRPNWAEALRMSASRIPHARLLDIDARLEQVAARPVIVPETIVIDHGRVFVSETFVRACRTLEISVQPARPRTPTDKGVVERTFSSINTLFCQHVAGYTGRDVTRRGASPEEGAAWPVADLQDLLDEWIVAGWQSRPHDGLRHPYLSGRPLSPNEAYAAMVAASGYVPLAPSGDDYIEMLPAVWRTVNDYGIRIDHRTYNSTDLAPLRRQHSGIGIKNGQWEVHYDPYDLSRVWVRDHRQGGWILAQWTHLPMVQQPFAEFTWRYARRIATERGMDSSNETAVAVLLAGLLRRAEAGPGPEQRATARTRAAAAMPRRLPSALIPAQASVPPAETAPADEPDAEIVEAEIIETDDIEPFGVFDPFEDGGSW